jgi:hypothetical protein
MDEDKIKNMKCKELQHELKLIKKPKYGVKAVLVSRLLDYYTKEKVKDTNAIGIFFFNL